MKTINVTFEEEEFKMLKKIKKKRSWHDFVMLLTKRKLKPTTDKDIEPELEIESDLLNINEVMEEIKELDPEYDIKYKSGFFKKLSGLELNKYAIELSEKVSE